MGDKGVYAKSGGKIRPIVAKGDPPVPQNEKVLTRFSQVGAPLAASAFPFINRPRLSA